MVTASVLLALASCYKLLVFVHVISIAHDCLRLFFFVSLTFLLVNLFFVDRKAIGIYNQEG